MWQWRQRKGELWRNGKLIAKGYSGAGKGKNNPDLESAVATGPIPKGKWAIGKPYNSANVGPYTIPLDALDSKPGDDKHMATGRGAFRIHGDSIKNPGNASKGCIIIPRAIREMIISSKDYLLEVVE